MPVLLPFRASRYAEQAGPLTHLICIPGEEPARSVSQELLITEREPALFLYRQTFRFPGDSEPSLREGVMGLLDRAAAGSIYRHEETLPQSLAACEDAIRVGATDPGSLWLWMHDPARTLHAQLQTAAPPDFEVSDRFGCLHQLWRVAHPLRIARIQAALAGRELFLADGHHRYAAGWNLATVQIRTPALRTLPAHRLVASHAALSLPPAQPIPDLETYVSATPPGRVRFGLLLPGQPLQGFEIPAEHRHQILRGVASQPVRTVTAAAHAVRSQQAKAALLTAPLAVDDIEAAARAGSLLPPKTTDFFPKLAAGIVLFRPSHQNETVSPPVPHRPGVRKPSS